MHTMTTALDIAAQTMIAWFALRAADASTSMDRTKIHLHRNPRHKTSDTPGWRSKGRRIKNWLPRSRRAASDPDVVAGRSPRRPARHHLLSSDRLKSRNSLANPLHY